VENAWVDLSKNCSVEAVAENWAKISDMAGAKRRTR
jgi:hypothetical protein